jgi:hypothetical protein
MNISAAILIMLAVLLTAGVSSNVGQLHRSDAAGNGLAESFAWFLAIAAWIILAVLLLICAACDGFPRYSGVAMLLAFPLGIAAQVIALRLLTASRLDGAAAMLLPIVLAAWPLLLIARAAWGIFAPLRASVPELAGAWAPILLLALISLIPLPFRPRLVQQEAAAQAAAAAVDTEYRQKQKAEDAQRIQDTLAKIAALPVDSDLFSAIEFCAEPEPAIREAARAKARTFTKRQADAEEMLAMGHEPTLRELPNFDLQLTPAVCQNSKKILAAKGAIKPFDNDPVRVEDAEREVAPYVDSMRWLLANGCDCKPEISGLEQAVGRFAKSQRREKLLAGLASAKSSR